MMNVVSFAGRKGVEHSVMEAKHGAVAKNAYFVSIQEAAAPVADRVAALPDSVELIYGRRVVGALYKSASEYVKLVIGTHDGRDLGETIWAGKRTKSTDLWTRGVERAEEIVSAIGRQNIAGEAEGPSLSPETPRPSGPDVTYF